MIQLPPAFHRAHEDINKVLAKDMDQAEVKKALEAYRAGRDMKDFPSDAIIRDEARRLFVRHEVDVVGARSNELFVGQGHPTNVFYGKWKYHPKSGLFVIFDDHTLGLQNGSPGWFFYSRPDIPENKGYFATGSVNRHADTIPFTDIPAALDITSKLVKSIDGYLSVAEARK